MAGALQIISLRVKITGRPTLKSQVYLQCDRAASRSTSLRILYAGKNGTWYFLCGKAWTSTASAAATIECLPVEFWLAINVNRKNCSSHESPFAVRIHGGYFQSPTQEELVKISRNHQKHRNLQEIGSYASVFAQLNARKKSSTSGVPQLDGTGGKDEMPYYRRRKITDHKALFAFTICVPSQNLENRITHAVDSCIRRCVPA